MMIFGYQTARNMIRDASDYDRHTNPDEFEFLGKLLASFCVSLEPVH